VGRSRQSRPSRTALLLDPFNALFHSMYAVVLSSQRRFDEAMTAAHAALDIDPDE
jgi:Flp pilus assembly protein TadD